MNMNKWQAITNGDTAEKQIEFARSVLEKGCSWLQFRFKKAERDLLLDTGTEISQLCKKYKATLIVNDHIWLAEKLDADGVHLGLEDHPIKEARERLGYEKIIGGTANTLADIEKRIAEGVNYIGLGPLRFTKTKEKLTPILGIEGYQRLLESLGAKRYAVPLFAIGGVRLEDISSLQKLGIFGIAASGLWNEIASVNEFENL